MNDYERRHNIHSDQIAINANTMNGREPISRIMLNNKLQGKVCLGLCRYISRDGISHEMVGAYFLIFHWVRPVDKVNFDRSKKLV